MSCRDDGRSRSSFLLTQAPSYSMIDKNFGRRDDVSCSRQAGEEVKTLAYLNVVMHWSAMRGTWCGERGHCLVSQLTCQQPAPIRHPRLGEQLCQGDIVRSCGLRLVA